MNLPTRFGSGPRLAAAAAVLLAAAPASAEPPAYDRDITPILRTYCAGCHNDADKEGEFSVERYASLRAGGAEAGDPIVPGDPAASALIARIRSTDADHMPPADEPQPPAAAVAALEAWIAGGGRGPVEDVSLLATLVVPKLPPHEGARPVTAVAVAADGGRVAVARGRGVELLETARVLEADAVATLADAPPTVTAVHFAADGRLVVAGGIAGLAGTAQIRDAASGAVLVTVQGHRDLVYDAELSPDGAILATGGYDRSIKLWNAADGKLVRSIDVHDGPVFDVAWHPSGRLLASASADETVKLWRTSDGVRLDTLNQPQAELFAVVFTPAGHVVAAGRDRQIHLWKLAALDKPALNPPPTSRFAHESPIVALAVSADGTQLLSAAEDRSLRGWKLPQLELVADLPRQPDVAAAVAAAPQGGFMVGRMDGSLAAVPAFAADGQAVAAAESAAAPEPAQSVAAAPPAALHAEREPNDAAPQAEAVAAPVTITGAIDRPGDADCFRFTARGGRTLLLEVNAARAGSKLDSRIEILDAAGEPVEQVVLQATRDSWLTFRGKNSEQVDDFRVQNWMEMQLDQYLYVGGEVVKLWHFPRGPDSGFKVYPGSGKRWTYFGSTAVSHPMGEPAWIVAPLPAGMQPVPNGLPIFRLFYESDDEPTQSLGRDSQLLFTPPADGEYVVRVTDVRGFGATADPAEYRYTLEIRPPRPGFGVAIKAREPKVSPGSGREVMFTAVRREGFSGPIRIDVANLPDGFTFHGPLEIEAGQNRGLGVLSAAAGAVTPSPEASAAVRVTATATVDGRTVVEELGSLGPLAVGDPPTVTLEILPAAGVEPPPTGPVEFTIRPGETITARVRGRRHTAKGPIPLGDDEPGRNLPHGVYVDNIGLNGLLLTEAEEEREFFITAAPIALPGRRLFHVRTENHGGEAALPAVITVVAEPPAATAGAAR